MAKKMYENDKISLRLPVKELKRIDRLVEIEKETGNEDNANRSYIIREALKIGLNELNLKNAEAIAA